MKTTIYRDTDGIVTLEVTGDQSPEAITLAYQKVEKWLFPKPEIAEEEKPPIVIKKKEEVKDA